MSGEPTEEESKNPYTKITLKECDPEFSKPTAFFTDLPTHRYALGYHTDFPGFI